MTCTTFEHDIMLYHAGELPEHRRAALEEHLRSCPGCAAFARETGRVVESIAAARAGAAGIDVWPAVRKRIAGRPARRRVWILAPALATLLLGAVVMKGMISFRTLREGAADMEIVKDLEFVADYELWEDLETLEKAELL
jgi:anti-sigma factor RsiW